MKTSTAATVIVALLSSVTALADELLLPEPFSIIPSEALSPQPLVSSVPDLAESDVFGRLDARQARVIDGGAAAQPAQIPTVTTMWPQTVVNGVTTYLPVVYTQTFASVPDQWPTPMSGEIGYGTLTKHKRDAAPQPTVYLITLDMVLRMVNVTEPIQPVLQVEVIQPVTIATVSLVSAAPLNSSLASSFGNVSGQTTRLGSMNGSMGASGYFMSGFATTTAWNGTDLQRTG